MRRKLSQSELQFIEEVAQERLNLRRIFTLQNAIFRANVSIAKPWSDSRSCQTLGATDIPRENRRMLKKYEELWKAVPFHFDDRIMIMHAAHAAIVVLILYKMALHPGQAITFAINDRIKELKGQTHFTPPITPPDSESSSPPGVTSGPESRVMTTDELFNFQNNPDLLFGKKFIMHPNTEDAEMYEVISYRKPSTRYSLRVFPGILSYAKRRI